MFPVLIDLGIWNLPLLGPTPVYLPTYGVMFALAVVLAWWWFARRGRAMGIDNESVFNLAFYSLLAGILGAKLLLILIDWNYYIGHPGQILGTLRSAGVLVGGVIAGVVGFVWYARRHNLPLFELGDAIAAPLVLAQGVGRLGCLSAGCCWGSLARSDFALVFTDPVAHGQTGVPLDVPLVPTQLIEMSLDIVLAIVLTGLWRRRVGPPGTVFWIYVMSYSVGRGIIELWRGDAHRGVYFQGSISTSQIVALAAFLVAAAMMSRGYLRRRQVPTA